LLINKGVFFLKGCVWIWIWIWNMVSLVGSQNIMWVVTV